MKKIQSPTFTIFYSFDSIVLYVDGLNLHCDHDKAIEVMAEYDTEDFRILDNSVTKIGRFVTLSRVQFAGYEGRDGFSIMP